MTPSPRSLEHGLSILEALAASGQERGVTEVGQLLGVTKSTAHRLMTTLVRRGYLVQDEVSKKYSLSLRMYQLGSASLYRAGLLRVAFPILEDLWRRTDESVHLSVLSDGAVTYVHTVESTQGIQAFSKVGFRSPAHCSAMGKAMLAHVTDDVLAGYVSTGLATLTPNTISDVPSLMAELATIRGRGYALDLEEFQEGLRCVAAPIRDHTAQVIAAVGLGAPVARMQEDRMKSIVELVVKAAGNVSAGLGYVDPELVEKAGSRSSITPSRSA